MLYLVTFGRTYPNSYRRNWAPTIVEVMDFVTKERSNLISTFERIGPDAPTLCEGWDTEDLLRHMVTREIYPHITLAAKVPWNFSDAIREKNDHLETASFDELLDIYRKGPQKYSPLQVSALNRAFNTLEYVIHHEDIRRAQTPELGRVLDDEDQKAIWGSLKTTGQVSFAMAPVRIILRSPEHGEFTALTTKRHENAVTIVGTPLELALYTFGRSVAQVELEGDPEDVEKVRGMKNTPDE